MVGGIGGGAVDGEECCCRCQECGGGKGQRIDREAVNGGLPSWVGCEAEVDSAKGGDAQHVGEPEGGIEQPAHVRRVTSACSVRQVSDHGREFNAEAKAADTEQYDEQCVVGDAGEQTDADAEIAQRKDERTNGGGQAPAAHGQPPDHRATDAEGGNPGHQGQPGRCWRLPQSLLQIEREDEQERVVRTRASPSKVRWMPVRTWARRRILQEIMCFRAENSAFSNI